MEGLIPLVYRSFKKSQTRRKYECLSSGAVQTYDIANFYVKDDLEYSKRSISRTPDVAPGPRGAHHRRYNSAVVDDHRGGGGFALGGGGGGGASKPKQLVRFRSHRMLSCITGA